jgi:hypothetical protein
VDCGRTEYSLSRPGDDVGRVLRPVQQALTALIELFAAATAGKPAVAPRGLFGPFRNGSRAAPNAPHLIPHSCRDAYSQLFRLNRIRRHEIWRNQLYLLARALTEPRFGIKRVGELELAGVSQFIPTPVRRMGSASTLNGRSCVYSAAARIPSGSPNVSFHAVTHPLPQRCTHFGRMTFVNSR